MRRARPAAAKGEERPWVRLVVPRDNATSPLAAEALYSALHAGAHPAETTQLLLLGTPGDVGIWVRLPASRLAPVAALLRATYPDVELEDTAPPVPAAAQLAAGRTCGARWGLERDAAFPLRTLRSFEPSDPMAMTLGALAEARAGEAGALSLVLRADDGRFARHCAHVLAGLAEGREPRPVLDRALDLPLLVVDALVGAPPRAAARPSPGRSPASTLVAEKAARPGFRVTLRSAWLAGDAARAEAGHAGLVGALGQFTVVGRNGLRPRSRSTAWSEIVTGTAPARESVVLGAEELAGLLHPPGPGLVVAHLRRTGARRRGPQGALPGSVLSLADATGPGDAGPVGPTVGQLMSHAYVVGPSGTGKTTLLAGLVLELARTSTAGVVLDPHGDLVRQVLRRLPDGDLGRVVLLDLADEANLPGINPLWLPPGAGPTERAVRSAAVTAVFADVWGLHRTVAPNLLHFLEAALAALVACGHGTLADLPRFLTDGAFRGQVVREARDPRVAARWAEFAALSHEERSRTVRAILNKAADFDRNPLLGTVFGDPGPGLRVDEVMDGGRLLLVSLPRGLVPEGTVELVGSLLVSLVYQAALAREDRPEEQRPPVVAVIDEFQEFALSTFAKVVTATRKYGLGVVVANQNLSRVRAVSPDVLDTLLANCGSLVSFRTGPQDARALAAHLAPFDEGDLVALAPFETYWRLPGAAGPQVLSARTRTLPPAHREDAAVQAVSCHLRLPGRPLQVAAPGASTAGPGGRPTPSDGWARP